MKTDGRGRKRKRYEPEQKDIDSRIIGKLHHQFKEVAKASKKTKIFETQKLVKKLKKLRSTNALPKDISDCVSQLDELKHLNHDVVATTALRSKLQKDKVLATNEHVQSAVEQELDPSTLGSAAPGSVAARVQARLLSSKLMALSISAVVDDLKAILNPLSGADEPEEDKGSHKKAKKTFHGDADGDVEMDVDEEPGEEGEEQEEEESELGTIGDDEREQDDDGWESGSLSGSPEAGPMLQDEDEATTPAYNKKASATSTFLPSLSVGFVRGGSADSDWSDGDEKAGDIPQRKNRRGQRARQAIWEKKYGKNANHKKKEMQELNARGRKGRQDQRGSRMQDSHTFTNHGGKRPSSQHNQQADSEWKKVAPKKQDDGPLHPSWEAKKKQKEKQNAAILPSVPGRKIVF